MRMPSTSVAREMLQQNDPFSDKNHQKVVGVEKGVAYDDSYCNKF